MFLFIYILIGLLLGPSLFNVSLPEVIFTVGSYGFLFVAGLELNISRLREDFATSWRVAVAAFVLPFVVGFAYALAFLSRDWHGSAVIAVALAISALPVVVQILKDLRMYETPLGHTIVASATMCDVMAWLIFTVMLPVEDRGRWINSHLPVLFFFVGLALSVLASKREWIIKGAMASSKYLFGPMFFIGVGMKIHWQESFDLVQCLSIFALATIAKMAGVYWGARQVKVPLLEARLMAIILNARGAMEILFCAIALRLGLIDEKLFTSLTVMAVGSSLMASPLVNFIKRRQSRTA